MSKVTPEMVKNLRERTGVGMGKCKEALDQAHGDLEEAINILRKTGMASAIKKESRETNEGMIGFVENNGHIALVEINAETDFVVQNERFQGFMDLLCKEALRLVPKDLDSFLQSKLPSGLTVDEARAEQVQSMGENIRVKRVALLSKSGQKSIGVYSHMGGKIVTSVEITGSDAVLDLAKSIAMHVAAESPDFLAPEEVPEEMKEREREIARDQVKNKPANIQEKIIEGKLQAFYDQTCLLCQPYIKDPSKKVADVVAEEGKKLGKTLELTSFTRWQIGQ